MRRSSRVKSKKNELIDEEDIFNSKQPSPKKDSKKRGFSTVLGEDDDKNSSQKLDEEY